MVPPTRMIQGRLHLVNKGIRKQVKNRDPKIPHIFRRNCGEISKLVLHKNITFIGICFHNFYKVI